MPRDWRTLKSFFAICTFSMLIKRASSLRLNSCSEGACFLISLPNWDNLTLLGLWFKLLLSTCLELKAPLDYSEDWFLFEASDSAAYLFETFTFLSLSKTSCLPWDISTIFMRSFRLSLVITLKLSISLWPRSISLILWCDSISMSVLRASSRKSIVF